MGGNCLWSRKARAACREYIRKDEILRKEIEGKIGDLNGLEGYTEEIDQVDDNVDDSDIPLRSVIMQSLGPDIDADGDGGAYCVPFETVQVVDGKLEVSSDEENIWAYTDEGDPWREVLQNIELEND